EQIVHAVDQFINTAEAENLKNEMKPYINGLRDKSQAAVDYIEAILIAIDAKDGNAEEAKSVLEKAEQNHTDSKSYIVETTTAEFPTKELRAESGMLRINPNVADL